MQQLGMLLEPEASRVELAGHALPDSDHESGAEEDADFPELDLLGALVVACGPQDHELDVVVVTLELRAQVKGLGVLDRQFVEAEALANLGELLGLRLEQPKPDEPALAAARRSFFEWERAFVLAAPVPVVRAVDDHRCPPA